MNKTMTGLNENEVLSSRMKNGSNALQEQMKTSFIKKLIKNLGDPIIRILLVAFFVTLLFSGEGSGFEALGIAVSVFISIFVSTVSEYGSEKAFRKMQSEAKKQSCTVIRNGTYVNVSVSELVVGDCVVINAGDKIGADGILIDGAVSCDMSALNGESAEIHKRATEIEADIGDISDEYTLLRGALVTSGKGVMLVKAVGKATYYGKIAGEVQSESEESPLRNKLSKLAKTLSKFGYFCAACVATAYLVNVFFISGDFVFSFKNVAVELLSALTLAVSVVVVAVPEGLPMMITVVLSSNMIRMQKQNIRVRKPVGIETAGNVQILFTDKTGTLTKGIPKVISYTFADGKRALRSLDLEEAERYLLGLCAVHVGDSRIEGGIYGKNRKAVSGNVTDKAFLEEYLNCNEYPAASVRKEYLPFDSALKLSCANVDMTSNVGGGRVFGKNITVIKGAPEILLKYCNNAYGCENFDKRSVLNEIERVSAKGVRSIAVAFSRANAQTLSMIFQKLTNGEEVDISPLFKDACYFCTAGIRDEVRASSRGAIKELRGAGVQVVMVTGDSKGTATAIAKETGIIEGEGTEIVLESSDLKKMNDSEIEELLPRLRVVARALPNDKSRLVRIAKKCGKVTAMTGDGLNDAPALKIADVGFAMGSGTEVAKDAGDIIIYNNDISSIEKAVLYGRTIFRSIRKFVVFQLIMNLSAVGISIVGPFIGFENPVTVVQMLWINLIMDTLAAIAFAGEAPLKRYMKSPPLRRDESVLNGDMLTRIFVMGVFTVMLCLFFYNNENILRLFGGRESKEFMSGFFALFVFCGVFGAFSARSGRVNIFSGLFQNPIFVAIIVLVFCAQIGMIYGGGEVFRCVPLSFEQLKTTVLIAATVIPAGVLLEIILKIPVKK